MGSYLGASSATGADVEVAAVGTPAPTFQSPPVVWYGTSILQGGVASRPGNAFSNIVSRYLGTCMAVTQRLGSQTIANVHVDVSSTHRAKYDAAVSQLEKARARPPRKGAARDSSADGQLMLAMSALANVKKKWALSLVLYLAEMFQNHKFILSVTFKEVSRFLAARLGEKAVVVNGSTPVRDREALFARFQEDNNDTRFLVVHPECTTGFSLDDQTGRRPRVSVIIPTFYATSLVQFIGRTLRQSTIGRSTVVILFGPRDRPDTRLMKNLARKGRVLSQMHSQEQGKMFMNSYQVIKTSQVVRLIATGTVVGRRPEPAAAAAGAGAAGAGAGRRAGKRARPSGSPSVERAAKRARD